MPASLQVELLTRVGLAAAMGNTVAEIAQPTAEALVRLPKVDHAFIYVPSTQALIAGIAFKNPRLHQEALQIPLRDVKTVEQLIQEARHFGGYFLRPLNNRNADGQPETLGFIHVYGSEDLDEAHTSVIESVLGIVSAGILRVKNRVVEDEAKRLEGAQDVAKTVAHEINNALSPIVGYTELLLLNPSITAVPKAELFLGLIAQGANDAASRVQQLSQLARLDRRQSPVGPIIDLKTNNQPPSGS